MTLSEYTFNIDFYHFDMFLKLFYCLRIRPSQMRGQNLCVTSGHNILIFLQYVFVHFGSVDYFHEIIHALSVMFLFCSL